MKWTVKVIGEAQPGTIVEEEVVTIEREDLISPATIGLTIAEGKAIMESLQRHIVAAQVQHHGEWESDFKSRQKCSLTGRLPLLVKKPLSVGWWIRPISAPAAGAKLRSGGWQGA